MNNKTDFHPISTHKTEDCFLVLLEKRYMIIILHTFCRNFVSVLVEVKSKPFVRLTSKEVRNGNEVIQKYNLYNSAHPPVILILFSDSLGMKVGQSDKTITYY